MRSRCSNRAWARRRRRSGGTRPIFSSRFRSEEKTFDAAWAAVRRHGASPPRHLALAAASDTAHAREALGIYAEQVEALADGSKGDYENVAKLVARMASLRGMAEQAAHLAGLKLRFSRCRSLTRLLP